MKSAAIVFCTVLAGVTVGQAPPPAGPPTFRLFFLGHEIGRETATWSADRRRLETAFHFEDRGTAIDLAGSLELDAERRPTRFAVKGRNYRLFSSNSEVTIANGRARVRDLTAEREIDLAGKPFFPIDNYAPIAMQEALIQYWLANGRPAEINAAPSGPVRVTVRAGNVSDVVSGPPPAHPHVVRVSIDGVVWGRQTAWVDWDTKQLLGVTTWAGALPFAAFRDGVARNRIDGFVRDGVAERIRDLAELTRSVPARTGAFALVGARVIQATDAAPIENATVVVRDGRIAAVGPSSSTPVPTGAATIDARGKTIIPGLWDMHAHASQTDWSPVYLASGVTTIRDLGGDNAFLVAMRNAVREGIVPGPRYLLAGLVDGPGPRAFGDVTAATPDEGRAVVRRYHEQGFEQMKIYSLVAPDVVKAIVDEAHRLGMTVTGHVPGGMTAQSVVEMGFDSLAHMQLRGEAGSDASSQQIAFFKKHGTVMDPTTSWNELGGHPAGAPLESFLPGVSRLPKPLTRMFDSMSSGAGDVAAWRARLVASARLLKRAVDAGLLVVAGTDKGVPGFSLQRELELYVDGGMTPLQALQTATIMPARAMKLDTELGTIEAGKRADLVVLDGNPLEKISNVRLASRVVVGRLYDTAALWKAAGFDPVITRRN